MQTMYVAVEAISTKSDTQAREAMCAEAVEAYSDVLSEQPDAEWPFEPIDVFTIDHKHFYLADGFHRLAASQSVEPRWNEVPCRVHDGDAIAARMFGITANDTHGLRMSPADKRHCLRWLMKTFPDAPGAGPVNVTVPDVVTGPPVKEKPDIVEFALTLVTVPPAETLIQEPSPRKKVVLLAVPVAEIEATLI